MFLFHLSIFFVNKHSIRMVDIFFMIFWDYFGSQLPRASLELSLCHDNKIRSFVTLPV